MEPLKKIQTMFESMDQRRFSLTMLGVFIFILLTSSLLFYSYYSTIATINKRAEIANRKRNELRGLLERYEMVKKQQAEVDSLLLKDKEFKIGGYFNELIVKFGIEKNKTREPETSRETLDNGYTEVKLYATFAQMSTKQVAELLDAIEQNERVYTKEVEMYKPGTNGQTVNVNLLIATIEPKTEELPPAAE
ncbi:MAG: hypothetical protein BWY54_00480 [Candidatus Dependentiae bacterium ADurb.Bin331]|nr:MAG: hypothetical protein BWY54_00480 [Candidatus Dependentiae bacterium ADurb.Bin331]